MPPSVGIRFAHAALQVLADDNGIDLLHIKGPAVDDSLLEVREPAPGEVEQPTTPRDGVEEQHRCRRARPARPTSTAWST